MNEKEAILKLEKEILNLKVDYNASDNNGNIIITKICLKWNSETLESSEQTEFDTIEELQNLQNVELFFLPYRYIPPIKAGIGIGNLSNSLKEFSLRECHNLLELPPEIGLLINMTSFTISHCPLVHSLPSEIGNLASLTKFEINYCGGLNRLPSEIGNLASLRELKIHDNNNLQCIPEEICSIKSLKILEIVHNEQLQTISTEIGKIMGLHLEWSDMANVPLAIYSLEGLHELKIDSCDSLNAIPPEIGNLKNLIKLEISWWENLAALPEEIGNLNKLEELIIEGCDCLVHLPTMGLGNLKCLRKFHIAHCTNLKDLPPSIGNVGGSLQEVSISDCDRLEHFPPEISKWKNLCLFEICDVNRDQVKSLLSRLTNAECLQEMIIDSCHDLECLPPEITSNIRYLQKLKIHSCRDFNDLSPEIGSLECLQELIIECCDSLKSLPAEIGNLKNLRTLVIAGSDISLQSISLEMGNLVESLQELDLSYCGCLEQLSLVINNLKGLLKMNIDYDYLLRTPADYNLSPTSTTRPNIQFSMTFEKFSIYDSIHIDGNLNVFLRDLAGEPSELFPMSLLLPKSIRFIHFLVFDVFRSKTINKEIIFKFLHKYPNLGTILSYGTRIWDYLTVDMLHVMYFNRFGRSLQVEVGDTSSDGSFPILLAEKVWPLVLEEAQKRIRMDYENEKDTNVSPRMLCASLIYSIVREVLLPSLLNL